MGVGGQARNWAQTLTPTHPTPLNSGVLQASLCLRVHQVMAELKEEDVPLGCLEILAKIGEGGYGVVHKGTGGQGGGRRGTWCATAHRWWHQMCSEPTCVRCHRIGLVNWLAWWLLGWRLIPQT